MGGELITIENPKPIPRAADEDGPGRGSTVSRFGLFRKRIARTIDARIVSAAAAGLALGMVVGVVTAPRDGSREMATVLKAEIAELTKDIAQLSGSSGASADALTRIGDQIVAAAGAATLSEASAADRGDRLEKLLAARFAEAKEDRDRSERQLGASLGSLADRIGKSASSTTGQTPAAVVQPDTTGAIARTAAMSDQVSDWALREVQDGVAVIEDRKHRVLEVAKGDVVPGLGRVEAVERRGRDWAVTTGKGAIVPREW